MIFHRKISVRLALALRWGSLELRCIAASRKSDLVQVNRTPCVEDKARKREQTGDRGKARVPHYGVPLLESDNIQIRRTKHRNKLRRGMQSGRFSPKTSMVNEHVALFPDWSTAVYVIT